MSNKYPGGIITSGANAGYSVAFDGTGDYLSMSSGTSLGAGNFTIECWVYLTAAAASETTVGSSTNYYTVGFNGNFVFRVGTTNLWRSFDGQGSQATIDGSFTWSTGQWYHMAWVRNSGTVTVYRNGTSLGSVADSKTLSDSTNGYGIAATRQASSYSSLLTGYISNLRVVVGTALYTAAFTPPTQLLAITNTSLLTCNSPALVDQSSNNFTITANGNAAVSTFTPFTGTQLVPNPNTLANTQGVWSISDAAYWMSQNKWPMPPNYPLQSLRFNSADSAYLNRTPGSAGNRRTWTWSGWVKRGKLGSDNPLFCAQVGETTNLLATFFGFGTGNTLVLYTDTLDTANIFTFASAAVFRDASAWYHIILAYDSTQATAANRAKLYINGVQQTFTLTNGTLSQNYETPVNSTVSHAIGRFKHPAYSAYLADGYMADINFVDGQALTPSSFGANDPNTGVWSPVPYSGAYGTNGFRLSFQNNTGTTATTLGKDYSGNGNNWTPNNFSVAAGSGNDSLTDGPTNWGIDYGNGGEVRGNYCTLNPTATQGTTTVTNGNLDITNAANSLCNGTTMVTSGKWYWEVKLISGSDYFVGAQRVNIQNIPANKFQVAGGVFYYSFNGNKYLNGDGGSAYGSSYTTNDVIGVALNLDANTLTFYKNNVSQGAITIVAGDWVPCSVTGGTQCAYEYNFGQRPFAYPAPSGFKVLCTTNLPIPTVGATSTTLANKYMDVSLYTGTGAVQSVTNSGSMQPDFVWLKNRNSTEWHSLFDAVRGALQNIRSNSTNAEVTATGTLTSFNSNGFSLGTDPSSYGVNTNTFTYVAWQWKANGAGSSNTAGSISSTVSANQTAGISVVTWTNPASGSWTVGHGLGVAPKMIITKGRSGTNGWVTYHEALGNTKAVLLNTTAAADTNSAYWNNTSPTSSVFSMGSAGVIGASYTMVAYCFAEIAGFSKFGSYTGNGSADGPFVYCGFRPRFVLIKRTDTAGFNWVIFDTARNDSNLANNALFPNLSNAEDPTGTLDILSNGFKWRGVGTTVNASGGTYIFMAFAESPFNYSRAR